MTWMEIWQVIYKTIICYFFLLLILKIMGKREIGKVSTFDIVVFFVISELFSLSLNDPEGSILHSLIPIAIIVILQLITAFITLKSQKARNVIEGSPTYIIYQGEVNQEEMKKQRYNIDDLLSQLRAKDVQLPDEVAFAILEENGTLNVITKEDCDLRDPEPLIADGTIVKKTLERINLSESELTRMIGEAGYRDPKEIFIALLRRDHTLFTVPRKLAEDVKEIHGNR